MNIFNDKALRTLCRGYVKEEFKKTRSEIDMLWEYLNKLREEIKAVEKLIQAIQSTSKIKIKEG